VPGLVRAAWFGLACLSIVAAGIAPVVATDYPNRPVHWLIGFTAGGPPAVHRGKSRRFRR
jgi:hypothetical protein